MNLKTNQWQNPYYSFHSSDVIFSNYLLTKYNPWVSFIPERENFSMKNIPTLSPQLFIYLTFVGGQCK
jgi:hypothetical protein